jgi:hypothetical protein
MKKKIKIGWARKNWDKIFRFHKNGESLLQVPSILKPSFPIYKLSSRFEFKKVRITIEEIK